MAKIDFSLSSRSLDVGGGRPQLNAPMLSGGVGGGGGLRVPNVGVPMAHPATLPTPQGGVPLINQKVLQNSFDTLTDAALRYQDKQDHLAAQDALLRAREEANNLLTYTPQQGEDKPPGYLNLLGKDAVDAGKAYKEAVGGVYDRYAAALSPNARAKYLAAAQASKFGDINRIASHTVQQQKWYEGQVAFASSQDLLNRVSQDPVATMTDGSLQSALGAIPDVQHKAALLQDVGKIAVGKFLTDPIQGPAQAEKWLKTFGSILPPETRLAEAKKIMVAKEASKSLIEKNTKEAQANAAGLMVLNAPQQALSAVSNSNGSGLVKVINGIYHSQSIKNPDYAAKHAVEVGEEVVDRLFKGDGVNPGMTAERVRSTVTSLLRDASEKGEHLPLAVSNAIIDRLDKVDKMQDAQVKEAQDGYTDDFLSKIETDPNTGVMKYDGDLSQVNFAQLNTQGKSTLKYISKAVQSEAKRQTKEQQDQNYYSTLGKMELGYFQDPKAIQELISRQADPATALPKTQFTQVFKQLNKEKSGGGSTSDPRYKMVTKQVNNLLYSGAFSDDLKVKTGGKPYTGWKVDQPSWARAGEILQEVKQGMAANKSADPQELFQEALSRRAKVETHVFGSDVTRYTNGPQKTDTPNRQSPGLRPGQVVIQNGQKYKVDAAGVPQPIQ